jgi:5-methylcytosine-specific restriction endonuclease McrA
MDIVQFNMFDGKVCCRCGKIKERLCFGADKSRKDGLQPRCKTCQADSYQSWKSRLQPIPEISGKICSRCGQWASCIMFGKNPTRKDGMQAYCDQCRSAYSKSKGEVVSRKRRYWGMPEHYRYKKREDHAAHRDERNQKRLIYRAEHLDADNERVQRWVKANPDRVKKLHKAHAHRRRAWKYGQGGLHTAGQWDALLKWFGGVCLQCGSTNDIQVDHVQPLSRGGSDVIHNLQPLCKHCNKKKFIKHIDYRDPVRLAAFLEHIQCPSFKPTDNSQK